MYGTNPTGTNVGFFFLLPIIGPILPQILSTDINYFFRSDIINSLIVYITLLFSKIET